MLVGANTYRGTTNVAVGTLIVQPWELFERGNIWRNNVYSSSRSTLGGMASGGTGGAALSTFISGPSEGHDSAIVSASGVDGIRKVPCSENCVANLRCRLSFAHGCHIQIGIMILKVSTL
jgi:hypothetical protein